MIKTGPDGARRRCPRRSRGRRHYRRGTAPADQLAGDCHVLIFVALTLYITYWASKRVRSRSDTAGGNITGFQNGDFIAGAIAGDIGVVLGISALVYTSGYDGLIYSLGFLVGRPIILFLIAERLRNLGRYTFADVAPPEAGADHLSACGSLVVVALYLIAQMSRRRQS